MVGSQTQKFRIFQRNYKKYDHVIFLIKISLLQHIQMEAHSISMEPKPNIIKGFHIIKLAIFLFNLLNL